MFAYPQSLDKRYARSLLRLRWLVLSITCLGFVSFESYEHSLNWNSLEFWLEIIFYGLVVPSVAWLLLTLLASHIARQAKSEENLTLYRYFTQRLVQAREWDELTRFLTENIGLIFSAEHTALFIYNHRTARLELAADWNASTGQASPMRPPPPYSERCSTCLATGMRHTTTCAPTPGVAGHEFLDQWCVPLTYNHLLVGILRGRCQPGKTLTQDQIEFLDGVSSEIALTLALTISHPRQLAQVRATTQLEERRKFAWVMHNSLAQQVGSLHLSLDRLAKDPQFPKTAKVQDELEYLTRVSGEAYEQIRNILTLLRPGGIADISQVLASYARLVAQRANLRLDVVTQGEPHALSQPLSQSIFGVVQEGLNNVEKHAHAGRLQMTLNWSADSLSISLDDDGVGFTPSAFPPEGHYGLVMMREWIGILGGELTIQSSPGRGAQLSFRIPFQPPPANPAEQMVFADPTRIRV